MAATMAAGSLYPGMRTTQEATNPRVGAARTPVASGADWAQVPVLSSVSRGVGLPVPALIALGVLAWWLFRQYD